MNGPLFNALRLKEIKRLYAVKGHAISQLHVECIVLFFEVIREVKILFAEETHSFFLQG
jgi:hypothetical protein